PAHGRARATDPRDAVRGRRLGGSRAPHPRPRRPPRRAARVRATGAPRRLPLSAPAADGAGRRRAFALDREHDRADVEEVGPRRVRLPPVPATARRFALELATSPPQALAP